MFMKTFCINLKFFLVPTILFVIFSFTQEQEKQKMTIEWIYGKERQQIDRVPDYIWLEDGTAIILDNRKAASESTFEKIIPSKKERRDALKMKKALQNLSNYLPQDSIPSVLPWPKELDGRGKKAIFLLSKDVFVLHLMDATFKRITDTHSAERAVHFSPDGHKISYVRNNDLYYYDLATQVETRLTFDGSKTLLNGTLSWVYWEEIFGRNDIAYWWSEDSRAIAYLQSDDENVSMMHYVDFKPQTPREIQQRYPKAGQINPRVKLGIVQINKAKTVWVNLDKEKYEYLVRVKWITNKNKLSVQTLNRDQTDLNMFLVTPETGESKKIFTEKNEGWVTIHDDLYFLKKQNAFIWASERNGYNHLYRFSMDGKLINQITKGEWSLKSSGGVVSWLENAISAVDEKNEWIYFTALKKSSIERHLYRIKFDGTQMQRLTKEDGVHRISFSPDAGYYFDEYSNAYTPPSLNLYDSDGHKIMEISRSKKDKLAKYNLQFQEFFTIPAKDGFLMPASLVKPKNFDPTKKYPVIFYVYGGPASPTVRNSWSYYYYFENILLDNGYLIIRVDNRSATGISKSLENLIVKKMMSDIELNDLLDAISWAKSQSFVDPNRLGIWGWSGGGMYTLLAMTRSKEFKAGIAVAAVTDWQYYDTRFTEFGMRTPQENPEGYKHTSLVKRAKDLHGRLLLVHGSYDDNVHIQNTWAFADQLIKHNIMFDMMIYPMRKHGIRDNPARIHLYHKMLEFWKANL